ncbi:MAG: hypothetical protein GY943_28200 [Chloroflexi bacterium]|nr:hypothetical protein [Chloroflexota bacterium]
MFFEAGWSNFVHGGLSSASSATAVNPSIHASTMSNVNAIGTTERVYCRLPGDKITAWPLKAGQVPTG